MNQIALALQQAIHCVREIAPNLAHPKPTRARGDTGNLHSSRGQLHEMKNRTTNRCRPLRVPGFNREEISSHDQLPMLRQELLPGRLPAPFRRRFDAMPPENIRDGAARNAVPQVEERTLDPTISPSAVFFRYPHYQPLDLVGCAPP